MAVSRTAVCAAALGALAALAAGPMTPARAAPAQSFRLPVTGSASFGTLGTLSFTGAVNVVFPGDPVHPGDPVRLVHTNLLRVAGSNAAVSCAARGAANFQLADAGTLVFTGSYRLSPGDPIRPAGPSAACENLQVSIQYAFALVDGQVVGQPTATVLNPFDQ